ncbi:MAG: hypothetical protein BGO63_03760 [Candidatus Accumulibacter sp. 66-26]|nr:MAG: hypothetical protein BGO63_03760 [Candidatus Accumulibacter sp. 66-26]
MQRLMKSTPVFLVLYLLFMIPTYILPYFGSNSSLGTLIGGAVAGWGGMFPPQWWAHMFVLGTLVVIAWARGSALVGKGYLPVVALLAAIFDMTPVLRAIPLVPTALHVLVLIQGLIKCELKEENSVPAPMWKQPIGVLGAMTAIAVVGTSWSMVSMKNSLTATAKKTNDNTKIAQLLASPNKRDHDIKAPAAETKAAAPVVKDTYPALDAKPAPTASLQPQATAVSAPATPATPAPIAGTPSHLPVSAEKVPVAVKPQEKAVTVHKPMVVASANSGAVADFLSEGRNCLAAKRYDCALSQAKAALRLEPKNSAAKTLLAKSQAGQREALDSIEIR